jgi:hypothetical protein
MLRAWVVVLPLCGWAATAPAWPPRCNAVAGLNGSALCIAVEMKDGKVSATVTKFSPNAKLQKGRAVADDLAAEAANAIAEFPKPYWAAFDHAQRVAARSGPVDERSKEIRDFTNPDWKVFANKFVVWATDKHTANDPTIVLSTAGTLFRRLDTIRFGTALLFEDFETESGIVIFRVADRIDPATVLIEIPNLTDKQRHAERVADIRKALKPLHGEMWCRRNIEKRISAFYARRDVQPQFMSIDPRGPLIQFTESPRTR